MGATPPTNAPLGAKPLLNKKEEPSIICPITNLRRLEYSFANYSYLLFANLVIIDFAKKSENSYLFNRSIDSFPRISKEIYQD